MISSKFLLLFRALLSLIFVTNFESFQLSNAAPIVSNEIQAKMYLQKYGYMNESSSNEVMNETSFVSAIKDFQSFAGLLETGLLDNSTLTMMNMPRCGDPDEVGRSSAARRKRYVLHGTKWGTTDLTYRISKYPRSLDRQSVDREIAKAFKIWSDVSNLEFTRIDRGKASFDIRFESGDHGDDRPFPGPLGEQGHAFTPPYGDIHFDDDQEWTANQYHGINLFQVAAHEIGHALGLKHSQVKSSVMVSNSQAYNPYFRLDRDDILGIQSLYGRSRSAYPPERPPDLCQDSSIDAFTRTQDGRAYVFKGAYYWEVTDEGVSDGYPRKIADDWGGIPNDLDAAYTYKNGKTFFFKNQHMWRTVNKIMDSKYPKLISETFHGIPDYIDAAFIWSGNQESYFFKGQYYWMFDSQGRVSSEFPKPISMWEGLPSNIDAAIQWNNQRTYFFKGREYYKYNDEEDSDGRYDICTLKNTPLRTGGYYSCTPDFYLRQLSTSLRASLSQLASDEGLNLLPFVEFSLGGLIMV